MAATGMKLTDRFMYEYEKDGESISVEIVEYQIDVKEWKKRRKP